MGHAIKYGTADLDFDFLPAFVLSTLVVQVPLFPTAFAEHVQEMRFVIGILSHLFFVKIQSQSWSFRNDNLTIDYLSRVVRDLFREGRCKIFEDLLNHDVWCGGVNVKTRCRRHWTLCIVRRYLNVMCLGNRADLLDLGDSSAGDGIGLDDLRSSGRHECQE